ncbi:MAG: tripartite tricarboxylate transporter TctB family protein [Candidatus Rokubacteria bacterium]|nr:tripartite tricarboxylate transporter TctB family protein [Candidatus Rokubacteria bacterium]
MRCADRIAGAALLAFSVAFAVGALRHYTYWGASGPGSAFLPFWLGVGMAVLAGMQLVGAVRSGVAGPAWLPRGEGLRRLVVVLAVTVAFVALLKVVGMILGTVLFLIVLLRWLEGYRWPVTLGVAVLAAGANYLVFTYWLRVPFPVSALGF